MKQGSNSTIELSSMPSSAKGIHRLSLGAVRRLKRLLPAGEAPRRVPFGVTAGLRIESDLRGPAYFTLGLYEYEIHNWLRRLAASGGRAFDIGAASGVQTLALARLTGTTVVAFERDQQALEALRRNAAANPHYGFLLEVEERFVGDTTVPGQTTTLDDYLAGHEPPTMLKIDVEGAEVDVLRGARRLLAEHRPHLLIETHSASAERNVARILLNHGYVPTVIERRRRLREDRPAKHNRWIAATGAPPTR